MQPAGPDSTPQPITVALVGNPNTGKTTLFNALCGMRQRVGNYPGVTVETKKGKSRHGAIPLDVVDLPGTYSLAPRSPDEFVAVDLVLGHQPGEKRPDVIISIVDASNLERNLYLTTQLLDLGTPVVVALNMLDIAESQGRKIDVTKLSERLGLPVVPIQANVKRGLDELKAAVVATADRVGPELRPEFPAAFDEEVQRLSNWIDSKRTGAGPIEPFLTRRLLLDVGGYTEQQLQKQLGDGLAGRIAEARDRLKAAGHPVAALEARMRYGWLRQKLHGVVDKPAQRPITWTERIDHILTHRVKGTFIFFLLMFLMFVSIFWLAKYPMDLITSGLDAVGGWCYGQLGRGPLGSLVKDGIFKGVGGVLVFLPQIVILFGFLAILEDCGYMARAAFLMDKVMSRCGLSGKSFIPLLSSFACAIPGVMATRVIEDRRDRLATILVAPLMSCSARIPVYTLMVAALLPATNFAGQLLQGFVVFALYLLGIVLAPLVAFLLKRAVLGGATPVFVMELPPYKVPALGTVLHRMFDRGWAFVRRASTLILASMILVWALLYYPNTGSNEAGETIHYETAIGEIEDEIETGQKALEKLNADQDRLSENDPTHESTAAKIRELEKEIGDKEEQMNALQGDWKRNSILGQMGRGIEPVVRPLGWDWRIGMAALASFPAREVVVGTLGIIFNVGEADAEAEPLQDEIRKATWDDSGKPLFTLPVALSVMVFFALCSQCVSTLAVIRRETNSWGWPLFTFVYMTLLAYFGAFVTYQLGTWLGG